MKNEKQIIDNYNKLTRDIETVEQIINKRWNIIQKKLDVSARVLFIKNEKIKQWDDWANLILINGLYQVGDIYDMDGYSFIIRENKLLTKIKGGQFQYRLVDDKHIFTILDKLPVDKKIVDSLQKIKEIMNRYSEHNQKERETSIIIEKKLEMKNKRYIDGFSVKLINPYIQIKKALGNWREIRIMHGMKSKRRVHIEMIQLLNNEFYEGIVNVLDNDLRMILDKKENTVNGWFNEIETLFEQYKPVIAIMSIK